MNNCKSSKSYIAYVRVSTPRQGEHGVSLVEQRRAIEQYAADRNIQISTWFTETQSASTRNRIVFREAIDILQNGGAELGELIDRGIKIHFVQDRFELASRGGRLAADIQAVIAADYIRNLREETLKGIRGRLRQGLYPWPAPIGYRNCGGGKIKALDPDRAPLIREAFALYATGTHTLRTLELELTTRGLRSRHGKALSRNDLSCLLRNRFYIGEARLRNSGEVFLGKHRPLVDLDTFERVQAVLRHRRRTKRVHLAPFRFSRQLECKRCGRHLVGERQKGHVYYRCHTATCRRRCLREDEILQMTEGIRELEDVRVAHTPLPKVEAGTQLRAAL